jgi:hypothetical protein
VQLLRDERLSASTESMPVILADTDGVNDRVNQEGAHTSLTSEHGQDIIMEPADCSTRPFACNIETDADTSWTLLSAPAMTSDALHDDALGSTMFTPTHGSQVIEAASADAWPPPPTSFFCGDVTAMGSMSQLSLDNIDGGDNMLLASPREAVVPKEGDQYSLQETVEDVCL